MDREAAYARLAQELGIDRDACHMGLMDTEIAKRVPAAVKAIRASLTRERLPSLKSDLANTQKGKPQKAVEPGQQVLAVERAQAH